MNKIEQHIVLCDGRKLGYAQYGNPEGFPIIYCHGSQSSRLEMHYDLIFASKNGLRIITIDRPGHGISDFNPTGSILGFAKDVKQLTEHLRINEFSVAGMSAGSPFALGLAYSFPEKVYRTSIISGFAPFNQESKKHLSKEVSRMLSLAKSFPFLLKLFLKIQEKKIVNNSKKVLRSFLKIMSKPDQEILKNESILNVIEAMFKEAFRNGSKGVAYEISHLLVKDWKFELSEIKVPVTFWHGKKDNNVPYQWTDLMYKEISQANLRKYPEAGHLIIFEHADEIFYDLKKH